MNKIINYFFDLDNQEDQKMLKEYKKLGKVAMFSFVVTLLINLL